MKRVMSLDASTETIGLAVIDYDTYSDVKLAHYEFFKPPKKGDLFERLNCVREFIFERIEKFKPDDVALEDIILFMKGKSNAKTVSSLAVLNRTVGLAAYNKFGKVPKLLNVMTIRHAIKLTKKLPAKEEIPELVASIFKIDFPYIFVGSGKNKGSIAPESYDMADGMAVGLAFIKTNSVEKPVPKKSKKKRKKKSKKDGYQA